MASRREAWEASCEPVGHGPAALARVAEGRLPLLRAEIAGAFRAGFLTIAAFAAIGAVLAWSIPARRL